MGINVSNLYEEIPIRSYTEIDELVREYQDVETSRIKKTEKLAELLKSFHNYFMKYVRLLRGELRSSGECLDNTDTMEFLALFLSAPDKQHMRDWHLQAYHFVASTCDQLEESDIYNELCLRFIELLNSYKVYEGTSFARYITKYLRWSIKAWVLEIARANLTTKNNYDSSNMFEEADQDNEILMDLPEMNLQWIIDPKSSLFAVLTQYERFLLYLNYKEGLGVRQIGEKLGRAKDTIHAHIREALNKLKEQYEKECNYAVR